MIKITMKDILLIDPVTLQTKANQRIKKLIITKMDPKTTTQNLKSLKKDLIARKILKSLIPGKGTESRTNQ